MSAHATSYAPAPVRVAPALSLVESEARSLLVETRQSQAVRAPANHGARSRAATGFAECDRSAPDQRSATGS